MAAPTIPATTSDNNPGVAKPSGDTAGDIFVVLVYDENDSTPTMACNDGGPAGGINFTVIGRFGQAGEGASSDGNQWCNAFYKVRDGTEGSSFAFGGTHISVAAIVRGADTAVAPIIGANNWWDGGTASPVSVTGVTTVTADSLAIIGASTWQGNTPSASGWANNVSGPFNAIHILSKAFTGTGATGSVSISWGGGGQGVSAAMFAFAPPGGAAATSPTDVASRNRARLNMLTR